MSKAVDKMTREQIEQEVKLKALDTVFIFNDLIESVPTETLKHLYKKHCEVK